MSCYCPAPKADEIHATIVAMNLSRLAEAAVSFWEAEHAFYQAKWDAALDEVVATKLESTRKWFKTTTRTITREEAAGELRRWPHTSAFYRAQHNITRAKELLRIGQTTGFDNIQLPERDILILATGEGRSE